MVTQGQLAGGWEAAAQLSLRCVEQHHEEEEEEEEDV
jgi:hypothetical protein